MLAIAGILIARVPGGMAGVWFANAAALWLLVAAPVAARGAVAVAILVSGGLACFATGASTMTALALIAGNGLEIAVSLVVFRSLSARLRPDVEAMDFLVLLLALSLVPAIGALVGAGIPALVLAEPFVPAAARWWTGSAVGMLVALPLMTSIGRAPPALRRSLFGRPPIEVVAHFALTLVIGILAIDLMRYPFVTVMLPLIVAAMRLNPAGMALLQPVAVFAILLEADLVDPWSSEQTPLFINTTLHLAGALVVIPPYCVSLVVRALATQQDRIRAADDRFLRGMDDSAIGFAIVELDGRFSRVNAALCEMLGYSADELTRLTFLDVTADEDKDLSWSMMTRISTKEIERYSTTKRYRRKSGAVFWAQLTGSVIRDAETGAALYMVSQVQDIDAAHQAAEALQEAEHRWNFALEGAGQGVWDLRLDIGVAYYSPVWCRMLGYELSDIGTGMTRWLDFIHPDDLPAVQASNQIHMTGGVPTFEAQFRMRHRNGHWIWVLDRGRTISWDVDGRPTRIIGTHTDITAQKEAEGRLRLLNARMSLAVEAGGVGLWNWNPRTDVLWWDGRMHDLFGQDPARPITVEDWFGLVLADDEPRLRQKFAAAVADGTPFQGEYRARLADGTLRHIGVLGRMVQGPDPGECLMIGTSLDITAQKTLEAELREANESIGQFAALASHDLQAPLRQIALFADVLRHDLSEAMTREQAETISVIIRKARHLQNLVRGLLAFSRATTNVNRVPVALPQVVAASLEALALEVAEAGARIEVGALPTVVGDPLLLGQVLQNVISNAVKYRSEHPPVVQIDGHVVEGWAEVRVRDNGIGIAPQHSEQIFQPFHRLSAPGVVPGAGLGLAFCRRILLALDGDIRLSTSVGPGSLFVIRLPAVPGDRPDAVEQT